MIRAVRAAYGIVIADIIRVGHCLMNMSVVVIDVVVDRTMGIVVDVR